MRTTPLLATMIVFAGCTSAYDVRVEGRVMAARPDAAEKAAPGVSDEAARDLEPIDDAIVAIAPRFGSRRGSDVAYCGPVDEGGVFRYASSGESGKRLKGVSLLVSAPGFLPVERFVPADENGHFDQRSLVVVLEDSRAALTKVQGAPPH